MRKIIKKIFIVLSVLSLNNATIYASDSNKWDAVLNAISEIESKGIPDIVSKNGKYVGILQISTVLVDECNRLVGEKRFTYDHRLDVGKSYEMFFIIQRYYNKENDIEKAIRLWNGGPKYSIQKTEAYYQKVLKVMRNEQEKENNRS
jgi:hypothetical protein